MINQQKVQHGPKANPRETNQPDLEPEAHVYLSLLPENDPFITPWCLDGEQANPATPSYRQDDLIGIVG